MNRVIHLHTRRVDTSKGSEVPGPAPERREAWRDERLPDPAFLERVVTRARVLASRVEKTIVARPWQSAAVIGGTGIWIGSMLARGSSKKLVRRVLIGAAAFAARRLATGLLEDLRLQLPSDEASPFGAT